MPKIALSIKRELDDGGSQVSEGYISTSVEDMTFRQWVDFHLLVESWPDWLKAWANLSQPEQVEDRQTWGGDKASEYWINVIKVVDCFSTDLDFQDLLALPMYSDPSGKRTGADLDNIEVLSRLIFTSLANYKPQERSEFTHKGVKFIVPAKEVTKVAQYSQTTYAPKATAGEVIEALQRAHIFGAKLPNGRDAVPDKRYHTDIAAIASVCRMVDEDGNIEEVPLGQSPFSGFVTARMQFLEDLPADIAIDVSFFLLNSVSQLLVTGLRKLRSKKGSRVRRRKRNKRGKRG